MLHASMNSPTGGGGVSGGGGEMLPPVELKANFSGGKMSSYEEGLMSSMGMRQASAADGPLSISVVVTACVQTYVGVAPAFTS